MLEQEDGLENDKALLGTLHIMLEVTSCLTATTADKRNPFPCTCRAMCQKQRVSLRAC